VRLVDVGKRYRVGGPWILREVGLDLPPGQLVRVVGGNGTGKSTLLRLLAGVSAPSHGHVVDRPATCYVPERFPPGLPFTARGYLTHLGRVHGLRGRRLAAGVDAALERFGLTGYAGTSLSELSKGTAQKVVVAQAPLASPALLVLDEAWTGLDEATRGVLDDIVTDRVSAGGTVVFVDHASARLAGRETTRWQVTEGRVTVTSSATPVDLVLIELTGLPGEARAELAATGADVSTEPDRDGQLLRLRVPAAASDALLRHALSRWPDAHVRRVTPERSAWSR
jgi:ABC-2 type transport system ATP-binding protein